MSIQEQSLLKSGRARSLKPSKLTKNTSGKIPLKKKPITRVGETSNFIVDFDNTENLIVLYGKEAPTLHGFKLGLQKKEVIAIINLFKQGKSFFP